MTEICNRLKKEKEEFIKEKQQETFPILHQGLARLKNREIESTNEIEIRSNNGLIGLYFS